jgi:hypothetical protein
MSNEKRVMKLRYHLLLALLLIAAAPSARAQVPDAQAAIEAVKAQQARIEAKRPSVLLKLPTQFDVAAGKAANASTPLLQRRLAQQNTDFFQVQWENSFDDTFQYEGSLLTEEIFRDWVGAWVNRSRTRYTYSGQQLSRIDNDYWDVAAWASSYRTMITYTGAQVSTVTEQTYENGQWVNDTRAVYNYSGGQLSLIVYEIWVGSAWVPEDRFLIASTNNQVEIIGQVLEGGAWVNEYRVIYYDTTIAELLEIELNDSFYRNSIGFFGNMPSFDGWEWDGTDWAPESRFRVEKDASGRVTSFSFEYYEAGAWQSEGITRLNYEGDRLVSATMEMWDEDEEEWIVFLTEEYIYDNRGLVVEAVTKYSFGELSFTAGRYVFEWALGTSISETELPATHTLHALYPNPFNPSTTLTYDVGTAGTVTIRVFDVLGREVAMLANAHHTSGQHTLTFEAGHLPSGTYFVSLEAPGVRQMRSVVLAK